MQIKVEEFNTPEMDLLEKAARDSLQRARMAKTLRDAAEIMHARGYEIGAAEATLCAQETEK